MRGLGDALRDGTPIPNGCPTYDEVVLWYVDLTVMIQDRISRIDWSPLLGPETPEITSRVKTIGTLQDKLRRTPEAPLQTIRDIAGVRFEAMMSTSVQDAVVQAICGLFEDDATAVVKDMRRDDHFGYRAVHIELRFHTIAWRAEIQVRTALQGQWANMYEITADILGREIRYASPEEGTVAYGVVTAMRGISTETIALAEERFDAVIMQEILVEDLARLGNSARLQMEQHKLEQLRGEAEPLTLSLTSQLERITSLLQDIRKPGS